MLLIKLMTKGDADARGYRYQVLLLGLGAALYLGPYFLGSQATQLHGQRIDTIMPLLVSSLNPDLALPLCYLSAALVGILALVAVAYNLRGTGARRGSASGPDAGKGTN